MSDLNLVLLGPPGAGKGTQAKPLAAERGLVYIATGDLLRSAVTTASEAGRMAERYMDAGDLVPDALVLGLLADAVARTMAAGGFILDGFPRTTPQADALDSELDRLQRPRSRAILIDVPDDVVIGRLCGRRICVQHGHEYHVDYRPPTRAGICDLDGSPLVRRDDDEPMTIRHRLAVYHEQTEPLIAHYEHRQRLCRVDGEGDASEIRSRLAALISRPWELRPQACPIAPEPRATLPPAADSPAGADWPKATSARTAVSESDSGIGGDCSDNAFHTARKCQVIYDMQQ